MSLNLNFQKFKYETTKNKKTYHRKRHITNRRRKRQLGGFLNRCDFAYAGRDTVSQAAKVAPGVIKLAKSNLNAAATDRINQITTEGGKEMERVLPKILRGAVEDIYQTPFRLLGNFGKKQFNKIKKNTLKKL